MNKPWIVGWICATLANVPGLVAQEMDKVGMGLTPDQLEIAANWIGLVSGSLALISFALGIYLKVRHGFLKLKKWRKDNGI